MGPRAGLKISPAHRDSIHRPSSQYLLSYNTFRVNMTEEEEITLVELLEKYSILCDWKYRSYIRKDKLDLV